MIYARLNKLVKDAKTRINGYEMIFTVYQAYETFRGEVGLPAIFCRGSESRVTHVIGCFSLVVQWFYYTSLVEFLISHELEDNPSHMIIHVNNI